VAPATATSLGFVGDAIYVAGTIASQLAVRFDQAMRAAPTITHFDGAGGSGLVSYIVAAGGTTFTNGGSIVIVGSYNVSATGFLFGTLSGTPTNATYYTHYTADAEL
jgi:hypothetical protein